MDEDDLKMIISDLILASVDTTIDTLEWLFLYLIHHPEHQDKIYEELSQLDGAPTYVINAIPTSCYPGE